MLRQLDRSVEALRMVGRIGVDVKDLAVDIRHGDHPRPCRQIRRRIDLYRTSVAVEGQRHSIRAGRLEIDKLWCHWLDRERFVGAHIHNAASDTRVVVQVYQAGNSSVEAGVNAG